MAQLEKAIFDALEDARQLDIMVQSEEMSTSAFVDNMCVCGRAARPPRRARAPSALFARAPKPHARVHCCTAALQKQP
eukprot:7375861-Prymnesium_polylepis.1